MVTEPGFHRAEVIHPSTIVRPLSNDRNGELRVMAGIFGAAKVGDGSKGEIKSDTDKADDDWESFVCEPCELDDMEAIGRPQKLPREFRKPTKQEVLEHLPSHWPFRS